jgi:hypothetical protein
MASKSSQRLQAQMGTDLDITNMTARPESGMGYVIRELLRHVTMYSLPGTYE